MYHNYETNQTYHPMLISYCHPHKNNIFFLPNPEDVKKAIFEQFMTEKIYTVIYRRSFVDPQEFPNYMTCFDEVFDTSCDQNSNLNLRIKDDPLIKAFFDNIRNVVDRTFKSLESYTRSLLPIKRNHTAYTAINFDDLTEKTTAEELKDLYEKFLHEEGEIKKLKPIVMIGIFDFDVQNL